VGILLKVARGRDGSAFFQMIGWNYLFAALLCFAVYRPGPETALRTGADIPYWLLLPLAALLPAVFLAQANSVKYTGIVRTDIAQRLSLIVSLSAAWLVFRENFSTLRSTGLAIGLISIFLILSKGKTSDGPTKRWYLPAAVLAGFGVIDVLFKKVALFTAFQYTSALFLIFCGAFVLSAIIILVLIVLRKQRLNLQNIWWGAALGALNFGNILFYLKAHKTLTNNPSTVFAGMNFGVMILGALVGIVFFREKLSRVNYLGLALALAAVAALVLSL